MTVVNVANKKWEAVYHYSQGIKRDTVKTDMEIVAGAAGTPSEPFSRE